MPFESSLVPPEIWLHILSFLRPITLSKTLRVSRQFYQLSLLVIYEEVGWKTPGVDGLYTKNASTRLLWRDWRQHLGSTNTSGRERDLNGALVRKIQKLAVAPRKPRKTDQLIARRTRCGSRSSIAHTIPLMTNLHTLKLYHLHVPYDLVFSLPSLNALRTVDVRDCRIESCPLSRVPIIRHPAQVTTLTLLYNRSQPSRKTLPVSQPVTGRRRTNVPELDEVLGLEQFTPDENEKDGVSLLYTAVLSPRLERLTTTSTCLDDIRSTLKLALRTSGQHSVRRYGSQIPPGPNDRIPRAQLKELRLSISHPQQDVPIFAFLKRHCSMLERFEVFASSDDKCDLIIVGLQRELEGLSAGAPYSTPFSPSTQQQPASEDNDEWTDTEGEGPLSATMNGSFQTQGSSHGPHASDPQDRREERMVMPHLVSYKGPSCLVLPLSRGRMTLRDISIRDWIEARAPRGASVQGREETWWSLVSRAGIGDRRPISFDENDVSRDWDMVYPFLDIQTNTSETFWSLGDLGRASWREDVALSAQQGYVSSDIDDPSEDEEWSSSEFINSPVGANPSTIDYIQSSSTIAFAPLSISDPFVVDPRPQQLSESVRTSINRSCGLDPASVEASRVLERRLDKYLFGLFHPVLKRLSLSGLGTMLERLEFTVARFDANIIEMVVSLLPGLKALEIRCINAGPDEQFFMAFWGNHLPRLPNLERLHIYNLSQPSLPSPFDTRAVYEPTSMSMDDQRLSLHLMSRVRPALKELSMCRAIVWRQIGRRTESEIKEGKGWGYSVRDPWIGKEGDDPSITWVFGGRDALGPTGQYGGGRGKGKSVPQSSSLNSASYRHYMPSIRQLDSRFRLYEGRTETGIEPDPEEEENMDMDEDMEGWVVPDSDIESYGTHQIVGRRVTAQEIVETRTHISQSSTNNPHPTLVPNMPDTDMREVPDPFLYEGHGGDSDLQIGGHSEDQHENEYDALSQSNHSLSHSISSSSHQSPLGSFQSPFAPMSTSMSLPASASVSTPASQILYPHPSLTSLHSMHYQYEYGTSPYEPHYHDVFEGIFNMNLGTIFDYDASTNNGTGYDTESSLYDTHLLYDTGGDSREENVTNGHDYATNAGTGDGSGQRDARVADGDECVEIDEEIDVRDYMWG